jgi:hypothetical protein
MTANQEPPSETNPERMSAADRHRQETWLYIVLPMLGAIAAVIALMAFSLLFVIAKRPQVALVSDLMLTVWVLCPLAICLLPIYIVMVAIAFGVSKLHGGTEKPLRRLGDVSNTLSQRVIKTGDSLSRKSIAITSAAALLDRLWGIFDLPTSEEQVQEKEHDSTDTE